MCLKFWKSYTLSQTSKLGNTEISYTVTAPTIEEARILIKEMQGNSS
jgi:hypothetical protein